MGSRVGLGITTLLTIMFLLGSVNTALPRVSYAKAIDWYLIVSFLFVFLVLLECILVYILRPRSKQSKDETGEKSVDLEGGMTEVSTSERFSLQAMLGPLQPVFENVSRWDDLSPLSSPACTQVMGNNHHAFQISRTKCQAMIKCWP